MNRRAGTICFCRSGLWPRMSRATAVRGQRPLLHGDTTSHLHGTRRQAGFSLIELVVVIVLLGIAAVALLQQFSQAAGSLARNEQIQTAAQLAQEGAEDILALRREAGYADPGLDPGIATDNLAGLFAGYSRTITITEPAGSGCPALALCKDVQVSITRGAATLAQIDLLLVDY